MTVSKDFMEYDAMAQEALRSVVREALQRVEKSGLPGDHHFYIIFCTGYPGVMISRRLQERYPKEMTVVLQNQFWALSVDEDAFEIDLSFNRKIEHLRIPFKAIKGFFDPSVEFGLQFFVEGDDSPPFPLETEERGANLDEVLIKREAESQRPSVADQAEEAAESLPAGEIVRLDAFRKK